MNESKALIIAGVFFCVFFGVMAYLGQKYEDNYCLTTPLERIDRDRCGLGEDK